jgi:ATP phosphoribosyltransferase
VTSAIIVGIPSKGRLKDESRALFEAAGLAFARANGARHYRDRISDMPDVEITYLSAPEIAREIGAGAVHLGITGRDQVEETIPDWSSRAELIAPLGFGRCEVVVAVPEPWIDVTTMADLDDVAADFRRRHGRRLTVATKYVTLTRRFFADHGIADYRIVESLGATEGAPAAGTADLIVDLTETGATLKANGLKVVEDGIILVSEAHLVLSRMAGWSADQTQTSNALLDRLRTGMPSRIGGG